MLKHSNADFISKFEIAITDIKIDQSNSIIIINECEIYALIKAHKIVFKRFNHEKTINISFYKIEFDMIQQNTIYNKNN